MTLQDNVSVIKGVGEKKEQLLKNMKTAEKSAISWKPLLIRKCSSAAK